MSSSGPPILAAQSAESQAPALRAFISHFSDTVRNGLAERRPWTELADRSAFSKPESFAEATLRLRKNYAYFRVNYLVFIALVLAFSLISHPFSLLLLLGLLASWLFLYLFRPSDQPPILLGRTFSDKETLGMLILLSIFVVFLTNVGSLLLSALMVGFGLVCVHGSFRVPEDLFLDDQQPDSTGFLSFVGRAASNAAAAAAPAVAAVRV